MLCKKVYRVFFKLKYCLSKATLTVVTSELVLYYISCIFLILSRTVSALILPFGDTVSFAINKIIQKYYTFWTPVVSCLCAAVLILVYMS